MKQKHTADEADLTLAVHFLAGAEVDVHAPAMDEHGLGALIDIIE